MAGDALLRGIDEILNVARVRNRALDITGALVFTGEHFAQYLEGPSKALEELMTDIRADNRHTALQIVATERFSERLIPNWGMAYQGTSRFVADLVDAARTENQPQASRKLIWLMKEFTEETAAA